MTARTTSRVRSGLAPALALALASAATTWMAMLSWRGFTASPVGFLLPLALIGLVVATAGALGRWRRLPSGLVFVVQVLLAGATTCLLITGSPLPDGELTTVINAALDSATAYAAPVPETSTITVQPLLLVGGMAAVLLVDLMACTLRRVPLAGLPLLTVYSVPVSLLDRSLLWWVFALIALGFLLMLYLQEQQHVSRWGRTLEDPEAGPTATAPVAGRGAVVRFSAATIAAVTLLTAVLVPLVVPTLSLSVFNVGNGPGGGSNIAIKNPMVDLRRDLKRGDDLPLIRFTTDDPSPDHLRISVLNRFSDNEWSSGDRDVPADHTPSGQMPTLQGVDASVPRREYSYDVSVDDAFRSTWLPTQAPISTIQADGDWRYDASTLDFIGAEGTTTRGLDYSMTAVELDLDRVKLDPQAAAGISSELTALPDSLPSSVRDLARDVTANAPTPFQKAAALQQWFREDGGFTYDLESSPNGNGIDTLTAFLDPQSGRVGYCEQFAASMAVMARTLGIPARVAVGFLEPRAISDDTWEYSAFDLHAWPELFFPGAGWVLFDPTPPSRVPAVPDYTRQGVNVVNPSGGPQGSSSASPNGPGASVTNARPTVIPDQSQGSAPGPSAQESGFAWGRLLMWLAIVLLVIALALLPRFVRGRQRARRLHGDPEAMWEELWATVVDLGVSWPHGRSPRETQLRLEQLFGWPDDPAPDPRPARGPAQAPEAVEGLQRIVSELEHLRYARTHQAEPGLLADEVRLCVRALGAGVQPRIRRRAAWLPVSIFQRRPLSGMGTSIDADSLGKVTEPV